MMKKGQLQETNISILLLHGINDLAFPCLITIRIAGSYVQLINEFLLAQDYHGHRLISYLLILFWKGIGPHVLLDDVFGKGGTCESSLAVVVIVVVRKGEKEIVSAVELVV